MDVYVKSPPVSVIVDSPDPFHSFPPVGGREDLVALPLQVIPERLEHYFLIVHYQNPGFHSPRTLTEPAGDVVFSTLVAGHGEDLAGRTVLHHLTEEEEGYMVGNAGGLLHVVSDYDYRVVLF